MKTNPVWLLWGIVCLSIATMAAAVILILTGHPGDVVTLFTFAGPILAGLLALKVEIVRRELRSAVQGVQRSVNGRIDELVSAARRQGHAEGVVAVLKESDRPKT